MSEAQTSTNTYIYVTQISIYTIEDIIFYHVFLTSLHGFALSWFNRFPTFSIDYFNTLVSQFDTQFSISWPLPYVDCSSQHHTWEGKVITDVYGVLSQNRSQCTKLKLRCGSTLHGGRFKVRTICWQYVQEASSWSWRARAMQPSLCS